MVPLARVAVIKMSSFMKDMSVEKVLTDAIMSQRNFMNFTFGKFSSWCFDSPLQWIKNNRIMYYWIKISDECQKSSF